MKAGKLVRKSLDFRLLKPKNLKRAIVFFGLLFVVQFMIQIKFRSYFTVIVNCEFTHQNDVTGRMAYGMFFLVLKLCVPSSSYTKTLKNPLKNLKTHCKKTRSFQS